MAIDTVERVLHEEDGHKGVKKASIKERMLAKLGLLLALLAPGIATTRPCPVCQHGMEVTGDHPVVQTDPFFVEGVRFWECPECHLSTVQPYFYAMDPETWR